MIFKTPYNYLHKQLLISDNHHRSTEKRNNTPNKISSKHDSSKEEKQNADSAPTRLSGGEIEEMLRNTAASPNQSELSPSSADPPEPEELIKVHFYQVSIRGNDKKPLLLTNLPSESNKNL